MKRMNFQFKSTQLPIAVKLFLITAGLIVAGLAIYKSYKDFGLDHLLFALVGLSAFLIGCDPLSSRKPYLLINETKIEYKIKNIGRPWIVMFDEIDSLNFDHKRLRINFNLKNDRRKVLFLRLFPQDIRTNIMDTIVQLSTSRKK